MAWNIRVYMVAYAEEHGNRAAERHFGPPPTEKLFAIGVLSKEGLKKMMIFRDLKDSSVL